MCRAAVRLALLLTTLSLAPAAIAAETVPAFAWDLLGAPNVVTLVNLHPDPQRSKLSSVNYLQDGLIPVCTAVEILALEKKRMRFRTPANGIEYEYEFHKTLRAAKPAHLDRLFGPKKSCPKPRIAKMSKVDQTGIKQGVATVGMTKNAVVIALGYPPEHATSTLELDRWLYWRNRFSKMLVLFANGKVSSIVD